MAKKEIDAAIRRAEIAERKAAEKDSVIERQKNRIDELDRKPILSDGDKRLHAFSNGELTEHEFVNVCFSTAEHVSEIQANLLYAAIELATVGSAQPHVGTGGGGSTSELLWRDKDKNLKKRTAIKRH